MTFRRRCSARQHGDALPDAALLAVRDPPSGAENLPPSARFRRVPAAAVPARLDPLDLAMDETLLKPTDGDYTAAGAG
jgi:hypothetical protein